MQGLWLISVKHYDLIVKECKEIEGGIEGASNKKELTLYQKKRAYSCI